MANNDKNAMKRDNHIYYFEIGKGKWQGHFSFVMRDWSAFWKDSIEVKNRFLVFSMLIFPKILGQPKITSKVRTYPKRGSFGVAVNRVRAFFKDDERGGRPFESWSGSLGI